MKRFTTIIGVVVLLSGIIVLGSKAGLAQQTGYGATTVFNANVRVGPGGGYGVETSVFADTPITVIARNADSSWLLVILAGGTQGWIAVAQVTFTQTVNVASLPVSQLIIGQNAALPAVQGHANTSSTSTPTALPQSAPEDLSGLSAIYLNAPVLPQVDGAMIAVARAALARGQALGNNPHVFTKIGDCMTDYTYFLGEFGFGKGHYDLGSYSNLQGVIDYFSVPVRNTSLNSFNIQSLASYSGMTSVGLQEAGWAIKGGNLCSKSESMLACDYRVDKPSLALIMVGFADTQLIAPPDFGPSIRRLVQSSLNSGVIPILSTFPQDEAYKKASIIMNNDIYQAAQDFHVPLINLDAALANLPDHGVDHDSHLTVPPTPATTGILTSQNMGYGIVVRNLITLQALDIVWRQLMGGGTASNT
ncbi:MAG TPA: SH3 domain-containing protein [Aggregatilineales bacterium]|nr:SH3 domain-containing protein [Aggregatilineales bacterium]